VGKFLKDYKIINTFPRIPADISDVSAARPDIIPTEEKLIKRTILPKILEKSSRRMLEKTKEFKEQRMSMVNFRKRSNDFDNREIMNKMREFIIP